MFSVVTPILPFCIVYLCFLIIFFVYNYTNSVPIPTKENHLTQVSLFISSNPLVFAVSAFRLWTLCPTNFYFPEWFMFQV
ncbi:hypothetical protein ETF27_08360 [Prevotella brunnea]|uniref:Uncharacterized protein n=1 Tax=Prevotella brunnea TaxID=2508867 RepID=A0A5C8GEX2_9BACT|nr:hypothetical protein ETF27_08360 [Prevotella brunnea]